MRFILTTATTYCFVLSIFLLYELLLLGVGNNSPSLLSSCSAHLYFPLAHTATEGNGAEAGGQWIVLPPLFNLLVSVVLCIDLFVSTIIILGCPSTYSLQPRPCCIPLLPPPHPHCRLDTLALAQTLILLGAARCRACRVLLTVHCVPRGTTARGGRRWRWRQTSRRRQTSPAT